ncbi:integrin alpha-9-like isoform X1 [Crassostrea virginica]
MYPRCCRMFWTVAELLITVVAVVVALLVVVSGYNVDTDFPKIFKGPTGSWFGVSTEIVKTDSNTWILVGAPRDNFTDKPEIPQPGNVYACPVNFDEDDQCSVLYKLRTDESTAPDADKPPGVFEQKEQLLGASILVPKDPSKAIVICAPNWRTLRFFSYPTIKAYQVVGNCFELHDRNDLNQTTRKPFRISQSMISDGYRDPLIGFSLTESPHPDFDIVFGSPNAGHAAGGTLARNSIESTHSFIIEKTDLTTTYQAGAYFGYSLATGSFGGDGGFYYVAGSPGFSNQNGVIGSFSIISFDGDSESQVKLMEGLQIGAGFGQALVIADVNGDGHQDILVSAPNTYRNETNKNRVIYDVIYDVGAIHIFYGTGDKSTLITQDAHTITGSTSLGSRFGTAISVVGDLNKDTYNDVVVGAPYEQDSGVVYIFNGNSPRLEDTFSQRILGSDLRPGLAGLGYYISKSGDDLDGNGYHDFAVGAYKSDEVVLLRARPIVEIRVSIEMDPDPVPINSTGTACGGQETIKPCFNVHLCFNSVGEGANQTYIDIKLFADAENGRPRVSFDDSEQKNVARISRFPVFSYKQSCMDRTLRNLVFNRQFFEDIEKPVVVRTTYKLSTYSVPDTVRSILKRGSKTVHNSQILFVTGCKDMVCYSNLHFVSIMDNTAFLIGRDKDLRLNIEFKNSGELSFNTGLQVTFPNIFAYSGLTEEQFSERVICSSVSTSVNDSVLSCDLESPLYASMLVNITMYFYLANDMRINTENIPSSDLTFTSSVSSNHETDSSDNQQTLILPLALLTDVSFIVSSSDEQILATNTSVSFTNTFTLFNEGPSPIDAALVFFLFPVQYEENVMIDQDSSKPTTTNDKDKCRLLYHPDRNKAPEGERLSSNSMNREFIQRLLSERPETSQTMACDSVGNGYKCAVVECSVYDVQPTDTDNRTFTLVFHLQTESLPPLQTGKASLSFVVQASVYPSPDTRIPLQFERNVTSEISVNILLSEFITLPAEEVSVWIIIVACLVSILLIVIVVIVLWKCGFFERKKRKELNAFKRKTQMSIRSARSARSGVGAGSVKSHRSITTGSFRVKKMGDDHEKLNDKNDAEEDENISPEENNKC